MIQEMNMSKQKTTLGVLEELKIEPELYDRTGRTLKDDPERSEKMKEIAKKVEIEEREKSLPEDYKPLDKETALKHVAKIESTKIGQMAGALIAMRMGRLP